MLDRDLFDIPKNITYLNCAYMSPLALPVVDAGISGVKRKQRPWELTSMDFFTESEQVREKFARLINTTADNIAFAPSASYGLSLAAKNLKLKAGRPILVLDEQFPSNVYPWREYAAANGCRIETVKRAGKLSWTTAIEEAFEVHQPSLIALPHCHWTDGAVIDLEKVSTWCRQSDCRLVIDTTQSLGALPFDVDSIRPDFMVAASYKWLLGPYSMGMTYIDPKYHQGEPLEYGWITRRFSENFQQLVNYQDQYQPGARRFDVGERANFALMPMFEAALDLILEQTPLGIQKALTAYTTELEAPLKELGLTVDSVPHRAGHFLGIRFADKIPEELLQAFVDNRIYVSVRGSSIRVTPHLYNTAEDQQRLLDCIRTVL